jgi:hypothetical protein
MSEAPRNEIIPLWPTWVGKLQLPDAGEQNPALLDLVAQRTADGNLFDVDQPAVTWLRDWISVAVGQWFEKMKVQPAPQWRLGGRIEALGFGQYRELGNEPGAYLAGYYFVNTPKPPELDHLRSDCFASHISLLDPRVGFNWATRGGQLSLHGGYGIYYDRVTLEIVSLERGLDGRALPIDVRLGSVNYLDSNGHFAPGAPTFSDPFTGFIIPGAGGASEGINIIDNRMQNPMVQQFNLGVQYEFAKNWIVRADGIHNLGTHFIIGVPQGAVFNPDSGGPVTVTSLQSSANTHYDALWLTVDHRFAQHLQFHSAYTLSKALNYANYDQIPFGYPPVDPTDLHREYGPTPNDQRHRLVLQGVVDLPFGFRMSPLWTYGSGVPMDILYVDDNGNKSRVPQFQRNAGGRQFHSGAELNAAIDAINANGGVTGDGTQFLPSVSPNARFNDTYNSFDLRLSKTFHLSERYTLQAMGEVFNLFNKANILGVNSTNYSGFFNVLVPPSPTQPSRFGSPVSTAGAIFGPGGPRAFQLGAKLTF